MKLIIQIPCLNEAETLAETIAALPQSIDGIDTVELLIIDDGSSDDTAGVASRMGVHHIVRHRRNRGLAAAFNSGMQRALAEGADIIVNTDADGQYVGEDIAKLVAPVVAGKADIVVGDRGVADNPHFGLFKRRLQRLGSATVKRLSQLEITDAVSGFRAISREAAQRINITTDFSYTTDMLIQAGRKRLAVISVPVRTNAAARPSRLFKSIPDFISNTGMTMARVYLTYNPLRFFLGIGLAMTLIGFVPILRFLWFFVEGNGDGHLQSLVLGSALVILGLLVSILGLLADLIGTNRRLIESSLHKISRIEEDLRKPLPPTQDVTEEDNKGDSDTDEPDIRAA
ncbi:Glycosyltransferase involved in cell wall bisynthesis [Altererythrobacter xiamenensis]|uniref:Glycosyltransferase involved in cell wall bisynthesis n=1 Tax=Altererythrobacter xiamenensis TaxID=1316679 RepID=A0A1Y6F4G6_9SPHN|nr:glycosyltransferase family 2 protein [Altererythrobacter xiamenensis]SMQ69677.1 Glycosyltransferase involved in cell wall bisynthesis [Altererythrobacter xiamenensis]